MVATGQAAGKPAAFRIKDCSLVSIATGRHAQNLRELRDHLAAVDALCVYNHFWLSRLRPLYDDVEYSNDFAAWAHRALNDDVLGERLSMVDPSMFDDLEELRQEVLDLVETRLDERELVPWARPGHRFDFMHSQMVIFDTRRQIERPEDLPEAVAKLSLGSVFYHALDARRRNPHGWDDFRAWLAGFPEDYSQLFQRLESVDWYFLTLADLRDTLVAVFTEHFGGKRS
ncbi:MAG: hypothetical protein H0Z37_00665 [Firmicutes bacterium]|nr:hypothetical protein [Bacillota bacterium]